MVISTLFLLLGFLESAIPFRVQSILRKPIRWRKLLAEDQVFWMRMMRTLPTSVSYRSISYNNLIINNIFLKKKMLSFLGKEPVGGKDGRMANGH